jgi:hypothetical protein
MLIQPEADLRRLCFHLRSPACARGFVVHHAVKAADTYADKGAMAVELVTLSKPEHSRLSELETVVERGLATFIEVGSALMEIRDARLYRATHANFEKYCGERWGITASRARQLIASAEVAGALESEGVTTVTLNDRQLRVLVPLFRSEGATACVEILAGELEKWGDRLTAAKLSRAIDERMQIDRAVGHSQSSLSSLWYTPADYIKAATEVLGKIDLDPASDREANKTVGATIIYTEQQDGLAQEWPGRIFLNPPYQGKAGKFVEKLVEEYKHGNVTAAIAVLNGARFHTGWFLPLFRYTLCFTDHPVNFNRPRRLQKKRGQGTGSPNGTVFVYLGPEPDKFRRVFKRFGSVVEQEDFYVYKPPLPPAQNAPAA